MEQRIYDIIFKEDEVTWQVLLNELVRSENMDPWNIDVSELTSKYIEMLKKMQEMDLRVSGKVVLAAAILLKFKSNYLIGEDMLNFDKLLHPEDYTEDALYEQEKPKLEYPKNAVLIPKTPQPRQRKVSLMDLVEALRQALEVQKRRKQIMAAVNIRLPDKKVDITKVIEELYAQIEVALNENQKLTFSELVPSGKREDKIGIFVPLLHLSSQRKIDLEQETHFGEIDVMFPRKEEKKSGSAVHKKIDFEEKHDFVNDALEESSKRRKK